MIDYIKGELAELTPAQAIVEAYGVGYALNISLNTYEAIQGKQNVKLFVHEALVTGGRDDSYTFFGFASKQERDLYRLLITVSGVGANTARMILSSASPSELCNAISTSNERVLKSGEFSNLQNNPILQTVTFNATKTRYVKLRAERMVVAGEAMGFAELGVK